jgi:hypothetical protein
MRWTSRTSCASVGKLEAVLSDRSSVHSGSARQVLLLACVDAAHAEELQHRQETFHDRAQLHDSLASRVDPETTRPLMRLIDDDGWQRRLTTLGVELAEANRAWRSIGLAPVHNGAAHARQFAHWLQLNRARLVDHVREGLSFKRNDLEGLGQGCRSAAKPVSASACDRLAQWVAEAAS